MLSTKNLKSNYTDVPATFILEYYLELKERLSGQEVKMKSIFNLKDTNPSMTVYVDKDSKTYKWKDFSSGKGGNPINLVMELKGLTFNQAALMIVNDYNNYKLTHSEVDDISFKEQAKYQVTDHVERSWNTNDQKFWTEFYIGTGFLNEYNVRPLTKYILTKNDGGVIHSITIQGEYLYGYFTKTGELYKIYQPKNKDRKFIKVKSHVQGLDQLKGYDILIIQSGMKDIGAMNSLKLRVDTIAPDSENTLMSASLIKRFKKEYKKVFVMFDNDEAGIKAMKKYRETYGLPCILLTIGKDIAEAVKDKGPREIRHKVVPLIELKTFEL